MSAEQIKKDKYVELTYAILDAKGEIKERVDIPVKYIHGRDSGLFPKIEKALEGASNGARVEVSLSQLEGFGPSDPNLIFTDDLANVPPENRPSIQVGAEIELQNERGEAKKFTVTNIEKGKFTLDANHPLSGQTIKYVVTVGVVRDATDEELKNGVTQNFTAGDAGTIH
ncbi:FKBP-type peptidyl-prolyl cis-trans isomerase [sulfur-oxidizing endosymbiont of Gigantopelta aegis]|uniref:FKBP-type peptidyl-prolyl cis-trans isomerase n=1 Tax=sulfur-oxidizing endosymbiont of Gigantopelta aegis TaxID=2794934 RepID=UPI0018DBA576|nr:peptidylprolyl isomerase [sulfur-oxidizing endosymbiont of Gigantopelta aegis]